MWNAVYKKLWIVLLAPLVAGGIAFFLTKEKAGQYRSVAVVESSIPDQTSQSQQQTQTLKDIQDREPDQYYDDMVGTMKTELVTSMVSYRLLLHDLEKEIAFRPPAIQYSDARKDLIRKTLEQKLSNFELLSETVATEATISQVIHNMDYNVARWIRDGEMLIQRRPATSEIDVATLSEDPFLSAFASNALATEYIRYETSLTAPVVTNDSIGFYREEVDRLRKNMEAKSSELSEASKTTTTSSPVDDIRFQRAKSNRIAEYEMRITEEEWELTRLRDQLAKIQRPEESQQERRTTTDVATNGKIQAIKNKIDQLNGIYAQGGSKDKKLDSIINVLRKQLNDETVRLQMASQGASKTSPSSAALRDREMLESRIAGHERNISSIRNDIRRLKNTKQGSTVTDNSSAIAQLKVEQEKATSEYNNVLAKLTAEEKKAGITTKDISRESHHLILKSKALPSAEPESPYAMFIVIGAFLGTLAICLVWIAATRPAPTPYDDIFLRVNYANQRRMNKKSAPVTESGSV